MRSLTHWFFVVIALVFWAIIKAVQAVGALSRDDGRLTAWVFVGLCLAFTAAVAVYLLIRAGAERSACEARGGHVIYAGVPMTAHVGIGWCVP